MMATRTTNLGNHTHSAMAAIKKVISACLVVLISNACVSNKEKEIRFARDVTFQSKITHSGLKHFEIRIKNGSYTAYKTIDPETNRSTKRRHHYAAKKLKKVTEIKLEEIGFCTSGYWLIDVQTLSTNLKVRGECNELASASDRIKYPNTLSVW